MLYFQNDRRIFRNGTCRLRIFVDHTSDHHVDDIVFCTVFCDQCSHIRTVTHNGYTVCDHFDLIHTVGNINDSDSLFFQVTDDLEQFLDLRLCQRCRRLIENDDFCVMGNRFCDLTHLLFSDRQSSHHFSRIDVNVHAVEQFLCFFIHLLVIDADSFFELASDEDVLRHCQVAQHIQLLMHDHDTCILCFSCIGKFYFFSLICNCTGIFFIDTCQHFHQC